jgi:hypothetical protein
MLRSAILVVTGAAALCVNLQQAAAVAFSNLDFESAIVNGTPGAWLPTSEVMRGWTAGFGDAVSDHVAYDNMALDGACIAIHDGQPWGMGPLQGTYSAFLQDPDLSAWLIDEIEPPYPNAWISQVGTVPEGARWLTWREEYAEDFNWDNYHLVVSINDIETFGDVSAFAGQEVELRFELLSINPAMYNTPWVLLDDIRFEPSPEPSAIVLLGIGVISLLGYAWRRRGATETGKI